MGYMKDLTGRRLDGIAVPSAAEAAARLQTRRQPSRTYQQSASGVMASPPSFSTSATATISGQVVDLRTDSRILWHGVRKPSVDGNWAIVQEAAKADGSFTSTPAVLGMIEFMVDCSAIEFKIMAGGTSKGCQMVVDGVRASATAFTMTANNYMKFDFGGRRPDGQARRIQLACNSAYFAEIRLAVTDTLFPLAKAAPILCGIGDSYMIGVGANSVTSAFDGWFPQLSRLLGYQCWPTGAMSATGYATSSGAYGAYVSRVQSVIDAKPDLVIVQGSINDPTVASINGAAPGVLSALKAGLPNAAIVATGLLSFRPTTAQWADPGKNAAIKTAADALAIPYIDTASWVTGSGNIGSPTGDGNADIYVNTDTAHPSVAGHQYLAARLAGAIRAALPDLVL